MYCLLLNRQRQYTIQVLGGPLEANKTVLKAKCLLCKYGEKYVEWIWSALGEMWTGRQHGLQST